MCAHLPNWCDRSEAGPLFVFHATLPGLLFAPGKLWCRIVITLLLTSACLRVLLAHPLTDMPPDRPPSGLSVGAGCVGVETCAGTGGASPNNMLRAAEDACEREQRSASDGLGRALTQCPAGQSRVRTVGKQAAAQRRDEGAPRGRKEALAVSCPSAAAGRSLDPLALQ